MLLSYCPSIKEQGLRIVLASASPRRKELIQLLLPGCTIESIPSSFAEDYDHAKFSRPTSYVLATALAKGAQVWQSQQTTGVDILISADTIVVRDGAILEKPASPEAAFNMLRSLTGRTHQVITGVTVIVDTKRFTGTSKEATEPIAATTNAPEPTVIPPAATKSSPPSVLVFSSSTDVTFADLTDEQLRAYIATNEPFDKAGGYGYQSLAASFIEKIEGDYYNVVGLPLHLLAKQLQPALDLFTNKCQISDLKELDHMLHRNIAAITVMPTTTSASSATASSSDSTSTTTTTVSSTSNLPPERWSCCFCLKPSRGYRERNNPWPLTYHQHDDCCEPCNDYLVNKARRLIRP